LAFEVGQTSMLKPAWEWFVGEYRGLHTVLLGMKRHPDLTP